MNKNKPRKSGALSLWAMLRQFLCLLLALTVALPAAGDAKIVFAAVRDSVVVLGDSDGGTIGSGVVIGKNIVVTNFHVVDKQEGSATHVWQARNYYATDWHKPEKFEIAGCQEKWDLCLLFVPGLSEERTGKIAALGQANYLAIGEEIYAFGNPVEQNFSLTRGIVSKLDYGWKETFGLPMVQTDADIAGGSSGGGLFNEKGELIGITTFTHRASDNISFAVPVELVTELLAKSSLGGKKRHAKTLADALRHQAELGNARAQFDLGWLYNNIDAENIEIRANQFTDEELWFLSNVLDDDFSDEKKLSLFVQMKAVEWYRRAAEQGHAQAQFNLGVSYYKGNGVTPNKQATEKWKRLAAEQGHMQAQTDLGSMYDTGDGVSEDKREAVKWYLLAARQGDTHAHYNLGLLYGEKGIEDYRESYIWFYIAAENGDKDAPAYRDEIAKKLTQAELREAQNEAQERLKIINAGRNQ